MMNIEQSNSTAIHRLAGLFALAATTFITSCHGGDWDLPTRLAPLRISPAPGTYLDPNQEITITSPDPGVTIKYTTDGTNPLYTGSTRFYTGPLRLGGWGVVELRAYAIDADSRSPVDSARYVFPVPWTSPSSVVWGNLTSGGRTYRTVTLGSQTWMAENLDDAGLSGYAGVCNRGDTVYCHQYGRYYTWAEAMGLAGGYNAVKWSGSDRMHRGICPSGWHIPNDSDWNVLFAWVNTTTNAATPGRYLKSTNGWSAGAGVDQFGFRVLPSANLYTISNTATMGGFGMFWSATESSTGSFAGAVDFPSGGDSIMVVSNEKPDRLNIRCLMD